MNYEDFLDATGVSRNAFPEEEFEELIQPIIADRRDIFPHDQAVARHFCHFGDAGFTDEFIERLDSLTEAILDAREIVPRSRMDDMIELAAILSRKD